MIPTTIGRVTENTAPETNETIRRQTDQRVQACAAGGREAIDRRLAELDREWDVERTLEANAATASLVGLTLGATVHRGWFLLPVTVTAFLLQHALEGWCPPLPIFRRLGFRTSREIEHERTALKALRGDFQGVEPVGPADETSRQAGAALSAARD